MVNIRELAENDLKTTLEGGFGLPVELTPPDGIPITTSVHDDSQLMGQVMFDYIRQNPDSGEDIIINNPVVTLRISSLSRVPKSGEVWHVKIPTAPSLTAPLEDFIIDADASIEGGRSIGFIRLYLRRIEQQ